MSGGVRCLVVWGAATTAAALLVAWLLPEPAGSAAAGSGGFGPWLVTGCALTAAGCVAWLWVLVTLVVGEALRGRPGRTAGVPAGVRRVVLAACGLSLAGGLLVPAHADRPGTPPESPGTTQALLVGLPLPDRTTTTTEWIAALRTPPATRPAAPAEPAEPAEPEMVRVAPGDTLWDIARATLDPGAGSDLIDQRWREIYRANLAAIGADPDLIRPGQRLLLPPRGDHRR